MSEDTDREVVLNYHSAARVYQKPGDRFVFHPITSASWVTKGSEGFDRAVQSHRNTTSLSQQQITEQTFLCSQELKKLDDETKAGKKDPSIGWVSYPEVDEILTDTAKRYIQSLQVDENGQFVSSLARTEAEGEEGSLRATHIDTSLPITLDEPFNQLFWTVDLSGTGFRMEKFRAANHPISQFADQTAKNRTQKRMAATSTSLKMEPEVQPELFCLDVEFAKPKGDAETGSLRLVGQAHTRDLYTDLDEDTLLRFKAPVEEYLNNIDPTSDLAVTIRGTGKLPKSAKEILLGIGAPIFQSGDYTGDQMSTMSRTRNPIFLELSVPSLQPKALTADTVYGKARVTALNSLDTEFDPEYRDDDGEQEGRDSLVNLYNSTIEQLEPIRPSAAPLTHWSDTAHRVMEAVTRNAESKITDGFGTKYTFEPKLTTWQYDGKSTSPREVSRLATESSLEDATHVKVQLSKVSIKGGSEPDGEAEGDEEELLSFIGKDMFSLRPTDH